MPTDKPPKVSRPRLRSLFIENYKKIDCLSINFPRPRMAHDLDVVVLGSKNGGGKTSILECSSLLVLAAALGEKSLERFADRETGMDFRNLLVKSGKSEARVHGEFERDDKVCTIEIAVKRNGFERSKIDGDESVFAFDKRLRSVLMSGAGIEHVIGNLLALIGEPLLLPPLLYFNSYRKIQEANPELGMMAEEYSFLSRRLRYVRPGMQSYSTPVSAFKIEILRAMMGNARLFEDFEEKESAAVLMRLNSLLERYAGGRIEALKPLPDNKIDFRIKPIGESESFTFDGLSSGQKEIVATLFLIWRHSEEQPLITLIDEPELHLNAEWHGDFVEQLRKLAPNNQYILATHSEEIFRSVDESRRMVLIPNHTSGKL